MRGPMPGIASIWASVAVLMLIGTMAAVVLEVVLAVGAGDVVDAVPDGAIDVSPVTIRVSPCFSDFAVQAAAATTAIKANDVRRFMKRI